MKKSFVQLFLVIYGLTVGVPFLWVLMNSFKKGSEIVSSPWSTPSQLEILNYANAWNKANIGAFFLNSIGVTVCTLLILIPVGAMAAYVLARYPFRGSKQLFTVFLAGMMFPQFLTIIPLYFLMGSLRLQDSLPGLVLVYVAYSLSFTIFVLHGFFEGLPKELAEAAMIDGAGHARTFRSVMLPLARSGIMVVALFNAIGLWNEYPLALVLISSTEKQTLPLGIAKIAMAQQYQSDWGALFAGLVIVMLPVILVYLAFRERIQETMIAGAVKG